ncbi:MAG: glycosyltransferase [Pseudomonadota bacterium]
MRFGVYHDDTIPTSGRRFFGRLYQQLAQHADFRRAGYDVVLCNISVPIRRLILEKLRGVRVVLRVDGLYFDALTERHLGAFSWPVRMLLRAIQAVSGKSQFPADMANFINGNWSAFIRILLADHIIYQSAYSQRVYARYFPRKPHSIVVNGDAYLDDLASGPHAGDAIRVATVFDSWKPAKRMGETAQFVRWAREEKGVPILFTLLGYTGSFSADTPPEVKGLVEHRPYIETHPRFAAFEGAIAEELARADLYLTFSFRDPCPNVVVESMAHGLPVVAIDSGGMADIVGDAGILLPGNDDGAYFCSSRYDGDFPPIDFEAVLQAIQTIAGNSAEYRARVRRRFETDLAIPVVAERYLKVLQAVAK